jgi:hypothetical protein
MILLQVRFARALRNPDALMAPPRYQVRDPTQSGH